MVALSKKYFWMLLLWYVYCVTLPYLYSYFSYGINNLLYHLSYVMGGIVMSLSIVKFGTKRFESLPIPAFIIVLLLSIGILIICPALAKEYFLGYIGVTWMVLLAVVGYYGIPSANNIFFLLTLDWIYEFSEMIVNNNSYDRLGDTVQNAGVILMGLIYYVKKKTSRNTGLQK